MAKGQMRSNKEKKKPKADKNLKKGGASAFAVLVRQDAGGPKPEQQEELRLSPRSALPSAERNGSVSVMRVSPANCDAS